MTTSLIKNQINFEVTNREINKTYTFTEQLKSTNSNDQFEFKRYENQLKIILLILKLMN